MVGISCSYSSLMSRPFAASPTYTQEKLILSVLPADVRSCFEEKNLGRMPHRRKELLRTLCQRVQNGENANAAVEEMLPILRRHVELCKKIDAMSTAEASATKIALVATAIVVALMAWLGYFLAQPGSLMWLQDKWVRLSDIMTGRDFASKAFYRGDDGQNYNYYE